MHLRKSKKIFPLLILLSLFATGIWWVSSSNLISNLKPNLPPTIQQLLSSAPRLTGQKPVAYSFAIISDAHQDTTYFPELVKEIAATPNLAFVAYLGDLANGGEKAQLQKGKAILDTIQPTVHVLPGDHDYNWFPQHDLANYQSVFGLSKTYYSFSQGNQHFVFIDNSDLNNGISEAQWQWLQEDLSANDTKDIYVLMSTPLSNPYLAFKAMGSQNQTVKDQSYQLGQLLRQYPVKAIFAGDTHTFAEYVDKDSDLPIVAVGAAGSTKNLLPLYVIIDIFTDGSYNATSKPYKHTITVTGSD